MSALQPSYYKTTALSGQYTLKENQFRRYLSVFSSEEVTITFTDTGNSFTLPANMPWAPMTPPCNELLIEAGSGLIMEA